MHANPYAAPESMSSPAAEVGASGRKLFTPNQVALAAFLGAPLGGSIVLAINFARLGKGAAAMTAMALGAAASTVILALAMMVTLPTGAGGLLGLAYALAMRAVAQRLQGEAIEAHTNSGGASASAWAAAGIALAALLLQFVVLLTVLVVFAV
ncbi:MAG: hypothetical protein RIC55_22270 [Pirellulaceae bacterium]